MYNLQNSALEVVIFKAKAQYSDEQVAKALTSINPILQNYEGFLSRQISKNEEGLWMDLVYWQSLEVAQKAAQHIMKEETVAQAFSVIDEDTINMYHFVSAQPTFVRQHV